MPAVELSRLRVQLAQLFDLVDRPEGFQSALKQIMERYAEHAYRPGVAITTRPIMAKYRIPVIVSRQLELGVKEVSQQRPYDMLRVADVLWKDDFLEPRLTASDILGQLPPSHANEVITRLRAWMKADDDVQVLTALLERGTTRLRIESPELLLNLVQEWLETKDVDTIKSGLRCIEVIVADSEFHNIPAIFRIISPLLHSPATAMLNHLHHCLDALAQRSQSETAFFLRQILGSSTSETTARLVRRLLPQFDTTLQNSLRSALRHRNM